MKFRPPTENERRKAIGELNGVSEDSRQAFLPDDDFEAIPEPSPNDWLAIHTERGQSFADFVQYQPNKPDAVRNSIYIQPLDNFETEGGPSLQRLSQFAEAFFTIPVRILPSSNVSQRRITTRKNPYTHHPQLLTEDVLGVLRHNLPADAFCTIGITMRDLYPNPSWNFVFGEASLDDRVGVFSF